MEYDYKNRFVLELMKRTLSPPSRLCTCPASGLLISDVTNLDLPALHLSLLLSLESTSTRTSSLLPLCPIPGGTRAGNLETRPVWASGRVTREGRRSGQIDKEPAPSWFGGPCVGSTR